LPDLRKLPLDGVDMFLLSCLESELTLTQLSDVAALGTTGETERRVRELLHMGLLEQVEGSWRPPPRTSGVETRRVRLSGGDLLARDGAEPATLRPPPGDDFESMQTLPPPPHQPISDRITPLRPPSLDALFRGEPTGGALKLVEPEPEPPRDDQPRRVRRGS
jgi:hypothetical protein